MSERRKEGDQGTHRQEGSWHSGLPGHLNMRGPVVRGHEMRSHLEQRLAKIRKEILSDIHQD